MTNPDVSLIAALLDRSGSMQSIVDDTRGFAPGKSLTYDASAAGVAGAWSAVAGYTTRKRSRGAGPAASVVFDDAERHGAQGRR